MGLFLGGTMLLPWKISFEYTPRATIIASVVFFNVLNAFNFAFV